MVKNLRNAQFGRDLNTTTKILSDLFSFTPARRTGCAVLAHSLGYWFYWARIFSRSFHSDSIKPRCGPLVPSTLAQPPPSPSPPPTPTATAGATHQPQVRDISCTSCRYSTPTL